MTYLFHGGNLSPCVHKLAHDTTLLELKCLFFFWYTKMAKVLGDLAKVHLYFFFSPMSLAGLRTGCPN